LRRIVRIHQDSSGNEQEREVFDSNCQVVRKIIIHYDAAKRLQSKESFGRENVFSGKITYQYTDDGYLQAINYVDAEGRKSGYRKLNKAGQTTQQIRFTYDAPGRITHEAHYDSKALLTYYKAFHYDAHSRETEVQIRTGNDHLKARRITVYNNSSQVTRQDWYDDNGLLQRREQFSYHLGGQTQLEETEDFFAHQTFTRQYDEEGRLLRQQHFADGRLIKESVLTYDKDKRLRSRLKYVFPNGQRSLEEVQTTNFVAENDCIDAPSSWA